MCVAEMRMCRAQHDGTRGWKATQVGERLVLIIQKAEYFQGRMLDHLQQMFIIK